MKRQCENLCTSFQIGMEVLAKPWTAYLIAILEGGALRFSEITERIPAIGDRILSSRLKELEAQGVVVRRVIPGPPVRVEYELTAAGRSFREVHDAISRWGQALERAAAPEPAPTVKKAARPSRPKGAAHGG